MFARFARLVSLTIGMVAWHVDAKEAVEVLALPYDSNTSGNRDLTTSILLNFEGIADSAYVGEYYNGVVGPNYGVVFDSSAVAIIDKDAGGTGNFANEPSPSTALYFRNDSHAVMSVGGGFTGLSLYYASRYDTTLTVYDATGGTGNVLATATLPKSGVCGIQDSVSLCGDPTGEFGIWVRSEPSFSGVAKSARLSGRIDAAVFDDVTIAPAPACSQTTYWVWDPTTDAVVGQLLPDSARCLSVPYNIEVRPCPSPTKVPVVITLKNATLGTIKAQNEYFTPFYLWGDTTATGDVYPNKKPLPKGTYWLYSTFDGKQEKIKFTQTC